MSGHWRRDAAVGRAEAIAPDGRTTAVGEPHGVRLMRLVGPGDEQLLLAPDRDTPLVLAYSADGRWLAGGSTSSLYVWELAASPATGDPPRGRLRWAVSLAGDAVNALAFSPDDRTLAVGGIEGELVLRDAATGARRAPLHGHRGTVRALVFSPNGRLLASGGQAPLGPEISGELRVWELPSGRVVAALTGHQAPVSSVAFAPDGTRLASGGYDNTVRLWSLAERAP